MNNTERAEAAAAALAAYCNKKEGSRRLYDSLPTIVSDLICDLLHLAIRSSEVEGDHEEKIEQMKRLCSNGVMHFEAELEEEAESAETLVETADV